MEHPINDIVRAITPAVRRVVWNLLETGPRAEMMTPPEGVSPRCFASNASSEDGSESSSPTSYRRQGSGESGGACSSGAGAAGAGGGPGSEAAAQAPPQPRRRAVAPVQGPVRWDTDTVDIQAAIISRKCECFGPRLLASLCHAACSVAGGWGQVGGDQG